MREETECRMPSPEASSDLTLHARVRSPGSLARDSGDLDASACGQFGNLHRRSSGHRVLKVLPVDRVHYLKLRHILQIDLDGNHIGVVHVRAIQYASYILQTVPRLLAKVAGERMGFWVCSLQTCD